jgi:SAM-dependent methyltransferase
VDPATIDIYEAGAGAWYERRSQDTDGLGRRLRAAVGYGPIADVGCGPGRYFHELGPDLVGLDATAAMLALARVHGYPLVRGDLEALPFASGSLAGVFARHSYLHLPKTRIVSALRDAHRALRTDGLLVMTLISGDYEGRMLPDDDFPGRHFSLWTPDALRDALDAGGFAAADLTLLVRERGGPDILAAAGSADAVGAWTEAPR